MRRWVSGVVGIVMVGAIEAYVREAIVVEEAGLVTGGGVVAGDDWGRWQW